MVASGDTVNEDTALIKPSSSSPTTNSQSQDDDTCNILSKATPWILAVSVVTCIVLIIGMSKGLSQTTQETTTALESTEMEVAQGAILLGH